MSTQCEVHEAEPATRLLKPMFSIALSAGGVQAMTAIVGIVTIKVVAPLGESTLSAATSGQRLYFIVQALLLGLNIGTMALVSRAWGAKDPEAAQGWLRISLLSVLIVSLLMSVIFWFGAPWMFIALGLDAASSTEGVQYIRALVPYIASIGIYLILAGGLRACDEAWIPLACGVVLNVLTIWLTWELVPGDGWLPVSGAAAVATAAGLGNLLGLCVMLVVMHRQLAALWRGPWTLSGAGKLWQLSYPAAAEQMLRQFAVLAFLWVVARYGTAPFAAYGAGIMLLALSVVIGYGFSVTTAVLVGQSLGDSNPERAKQALRAGLIAALGSMTLLGLFMGVYAQSLALWLVGPGDVAHYTKLFIQFFALVQPLLAADFVLVGALQGAGDTRWPLYSVILGPLVVRFGCALVLLALDAPVSWIYATMVVDYIAKAGLLAWRVKQSRWPEFKGPM